MSTNKFIDPYCDTCIKEGFVKAASGFCPKCSDFICYNCLDTHGQPGRHKILTGSSMPARQSEKPLKYMPCDKHSTELKDRYCLDHGLVVCEKCSAKEHKKCDVKSILVAYKSFNISAEDQSFKGTASHFLGHAQEVQRSVEKNLHELEKQRDELIKESQEFRDRTINQIKQSCDDFERNVLKTFMEHKGILTEKHAEISKVVSDIEYSLEDLQRQGMKTLGEARYFLHLKGHTETIFNCSEKLQKFYSDLQYIDMKSQFYLCIKPMIDPKSKFVHISLGVSKYEYDNDVPDIHIPCRKERNRPRSSSSTSGQSSSSDHKSVRIATISEQTVSTDDINVVLHTVGEPKPAGSSSADLKETNEQTISATSSASSELADVTKVDSKDNQEDASELTNHQISNGQPKALSVKLRSSDKVNGDTLGDQVTGLGSSSSNQKLTDGAMTFRRLSSAITIAAQSLSLNVTKLEPINAELHNETSVPLILGMDITADGNLLLVDRNNRKLKMFSPDGTRLAVRKLSKSPEDVAVINNTRAAVTAWDKQIRIVDVSSHSKLAVKRTLTLVYHVWAVTGYRNDLIVTCSPSANITQKPSTVRMIDSQGIAKWSVATDSEGLELFQWAGFLTTRTGYEGKVGPLKDIVIVMDQYKQTITVLDAKNGKLIKVCNVEGKTPRGAACDENGDVYVCYENGTVGKWSKEMERERTPGTIDLQSPHALAYDKKQMVLYVTSSSASSTDSKFIHRYHFRK